MREILNIILAHKTKVKEQETTFAGRSRRVKEGGERTVHEGKPVIAGFSTQIQIPIRGRAARKP